MKTQQLADITEEKGQNILLQEGRGLEFQGGTAEVKECEILEQVEMPTRVRATGPAPTPA